jgi:phage anti-repressor protein
MSEDMDWEFTSDDTNNNEQAREEIQDMDWEFDIKTKQEVNMGDDFELGNQRNSKRMRTSNKHKMTEDSIIDLA